MLISIIAAVVVLAAWSLLAGRLERWRLTAPMVLILAGAVVGYVTHDALADTLNTDTAQPFVEIILAVLLFIDATDVRGGLFGRDPRSALRVLLIALPLSLALSLALGLWLLPGVPWAVVLLVACVVVPIDFAPAVSILRDKAIPDRVRNALNVEAGYNDGIVSPVFIFALVLAGDHSHAETPMDAIGAALPQAIKAVVVGLAVGAVIALSSNVAERHDSMTEQSKRVILVVTPLLAYIVSVAWHGNGFVSAFVCGIAYVGLRRTEDIRGELDLVDDVGFLLTVVMWFAFGALAVVALAHGVPWGIALFCLLALTVVRMIAILLAMFGSRFTWPERLLLGWSAPRGTTSIVFGLLAFNVLTDEAETDVLLTMVVVVLGSVVLHGIGAPAAARAFARSQPRMVE